MSISPYTVFEGRTMVGIGWGLLALAGTALAATTLRTRMDLTPDGLVDHGPLRVSVYPAAEIAGFRVDPSGWGQIVRVVLVGRGSRRLFVSAGLGDHPDRIWAALDDWLESTRSATDDGAAGLLIRWTRTRREPDDRRWRRGRAAFRTPPLEPP